MRRESPIVVTRSSIGQAAGLAGFAALIAAVLAMVWAGELNTTASIALALAALGIAAWFVISPQEAIGALTGRQAQYGSFAVFATLIMAGIVALVYTLTARAVLTVDMTQSSSFTLSQTTLDLLADVRRPMQITGFYGSRQAALREVDDQIFRLYEDATDGLITRLYVDPVASPGVAASFGAQEGDVFISFLSITGEVDMSQTLPVIRSTRQERDLTEAISRLIIGGQFVIYFDVSLGGLDITDNTARGLSRANNLIQQYGLVTQPIDLIELAQTNTPIPDTASTVILAGPAIDPPESVIVLIEDYTQRGGTLFIMADVQTEFMTADSPFNEYLWNRYGLRMLDAVVVDDLANGGTPVDIVSAAIFDTEITASLDPATDEDLATQFRLARPIQVNTDPPVPNGSAITSSQLSYGETNVEAVLTQDEYAPDGETDLPGPLTTVAYAYDEGDGSRVLLVGDSDFVTNGQIDIRQGNALLFFDGLGWLTGFSERITFGSQAMAVGAPVVFVSPAQLDQIAFVTTVLMPGAALVLGAVVWWRRMRR
jgi:ABC-type uncharacterized transport system involved in gliding motility auxiliary subunit